MRKSALHDKCKLIMRNFTYDLEDTIIRRVELEDEIADVIGYDPIRTIKPWVERLERFGYIKKGRNIHEFNLGEKGMEMLRQSQKKIDDYEGERKHDETQQKESTTPTVELIELKAVKKETGR